MTKFVALISGKGGVGKTTTLLNLGHALTKLNKKVILLDANFATPNLALHLGITSPKHTLNDFLNKEKTIQEITYSHKSGINFIPSSISYLDFKKSQSHQLTEVFEHLDNLADFVLVDCPAGLGYELVQILKNTDQALVVTNPNLSSLVDSLKAMEIAQENNNIVPGFILNMSNKGKNELKVNDIEKTLNMPMLINIRTDKKIKKALHKQCPSHHLYPRSKSSKQYKKLAKYLTE